jgi:ABC-type transport system involved in cytochrome c biogenesis permease subunit
LAVKWTELGLLLYLAMVAYLAAAGAFARRKWLATIVIAAYGALQGIPAIIFRLLAEIRPEDFAKYYNLFEVSGCTTIIIFAALALFLVVRAFISREALAGNVLFATGFAVCVAAFVVRWIEVDHIPLQNMFEVFLTLGMLVWPISLFCRRFLGVGGEAADAYFAFIILFPAGFVFHAEPQKLPPALQSILFIPHVATYMLSYVIMAKAAIPHAFMGIFLDRPRGDPQAITYDLAAYRMVSLGFPLLTLGLVLGAVWGKIAWGDYWNWDPKELWSFVSWLVYLAYLHFRSMYGSKFPRLLSAMVLAGLLAIILTLLWVNLARIFGGGMHSYAS